MGIRKRFKRWYAGTYVPAPYDPDSPVFFMGHIEQPRLARLLGTLGKFWVDHWKWIVTTVLGIAAILVAN